MVKVPPSFVKETLWPDFEPITAAIRTHVEQVTDRVLADAIHRDPSEPAEASEPPQLTAGAPAIVDE
jgi:hypothetical protein